MPHITREDVADRITELLIEHFSAYAEAGVELPYFQKVVRNGKIQVATSPPRSNDERLVLYRSDVAANKEDIELLNFIYNTYFATHGVGLIAIQLNVAETGPPYYDLVTLIIDGDQIEVNGGSLTETFYQDNLGQFVNFEESHASIDNNKAEQILDTNIYELYPSELTKQQRIDRFFREYNNLKPPYATDNLPGPYGAPLTDDNNDGFTDTLDAGSAIEYSNLYDIAGASINQKEDKYITWRIDIANQDPDNINKSLEYLRNDLNDYYFLQQDVEPEIIDERPTYRSRSEGYLKIRTLNQAIIVRNEESSDIGLIGPDFTNPLWHDTGFTITMWVRFLDKVNGGTLFNFGNPLRENSTMASTGFMLETFIVDSADQSQAGFFLTENVERFVRLVVRDKNGLVRDSHVGNSWAARVDTTTLTTEGLLNDGVSPFNYTQIPIDLREWYFIVATFNPDISEDYSIANYLDPDDLDPNGIQVSMSPEFWRWNVMPGASANGTYTLHSGLGAQCKVEIISRTDLLRARGFKE